MNIDFRGIIRMMSVVLIISGIIMNIQYAIDICNRVVVAGVIRDAESKNVVIAYDVDGKTEMFYSDKIYVEAKNGDKINIAYNKENPTDIVIVGDRLKTGTFMWIIGLVALFSLMGFDAYKVIKSRNTSKVTGVITEIVGSVGDTEQYRIIATGINETNGMAIEAKSCWMDKEEIEDMSIGDEIEITIEKGKAYI